jgi:hypothetical protein
MSLMKVRRIVLEGFCEVNVKFRPRHQATMLCTMERFTPFRWSDEAKKAERMHKLATEPRMYEHLKLPRLEKALAQEAQAQERSGVGLYLLALLFSLIGLPEGKDSGIDDGQIWQTPQSSLIGKS